MKIVCDSCGAKYSIADEKVAGKVFKIRCKKCSAVIVVRGDQVAQQEQEQDQATQVYDYGSEAVWHVVVDGDQQGPFSPPQIGEMLTAGTIDWEAYVWREGFDGWMAARDVPELVEAVTGQPQDQGAAAGAAAAGAAAGMAAGDQAMGADPFGGQQPQAGYDQPGHDPQPGYDQPQAGYDQAGFDQQQAGYDQPGYDQAGYDQPGYDQPGYDPQGPQAAEGGMFGAAGYGEQEVASRATHDAGADLFAQSDASQSPFGAGEVGGDDDVVASDPGPRVSAEQASMTGQRNENSVLFSLSNLQALATGSSSGSTPAPSPGPSPSAPKAGHASGEGSGLIDIRALASTASMGGGDRPAEKANVDDLLSIGTGPSFGSSLGAPVLAPVQEEKSNKGLLIGLAAGGGILAVAAIVVAVIFVTKEPEPVAQASGAPNTAGTGAVVPGVGEGEGEGEGETGGGEEEGGGEEVAPATGTDEGEETDTDTEEDEVEEDEGSSTTSSARRRRAARRRAASSGSSSGSSGSSTASAGSSSGSSGSSAMSSGGGGDIDSLLDRALGDMGGSSRMRSAGGGGGGGGADLPATPPRDAVARALRSVAGAVSRCGQGQSGVANTTVTVSGSTGRVTNAQVTGQFAGTPVGSCVARAVRGARFPRFRNSTFQVSFPYRI